MSVQDGRRAPFCWQSISALAAIVKRCEMAGPDGSALRAADARSIYVALTEVANDRYREGGRDGFDAARSEIAARAGCSLRTVDRYTAVLVEIGLVEVHRRRHGGVNLPNRWTLREQEPGGGASGAPPAQRAQQGGESSAPGVVHPTAHALKNGEEREEDPLNPPQAGDLFPARPPTGRKRDAARFDELQGDWIDRHFPDVGATDRWRIPQMAGQLRRGGIDPTPYAIGEMLRHNGITANPSDLRREADGAPGHGAPAAGAAKTVARAGRTTSPSTAGAT